MPPTERAAAFPALASSPNALLLPKDGKLPNAPPGDRTAGSNTEAALLLLPRGGKGTTSPMLLRGTSDTPAAYLSSSARPPGVVAVAFLRIERRRFGGACPGPRRLPPALLC